LNGNGKAIRFVKECLANLPDSSLGNLDQAGNVLKSRMRQEGATKVKLSTSADVHKIGVKILANAGAVNLPKTIDSLCSSMEKFYIFPETAKKCSEYLRQQLREGAYDSISDPETLAQAMTADLRLISEDKHIFIDYNPPRQAADTASTEAVSTDSAKTIEQHYPTPPLTHTYSYKSTSDVGWMGATEKSFSHEIKSGFLEKDPRVGYVDLRIFGVSMEKVPDTSIAKAEKHLERLKTQRDQTKAGSAGRANRQSLNTQIEIHEKRLEVLKKAEKLDAPLMNDVAARRQALIDAVQNLKGAKSVIIDLRKDRKSTRLNSSHP
jgi:hypothetical protein